MEKIYYCPTEKEERTFKRVDKGIAVVGRYQCNECKTVYGEAQLNEGGLVGAIRDNLK